MHGEAIRILLVGELPGRGEDIRAVERIAEMPRGVSADAYGAVGLATEASDVDEDLIDRYGALIALLGHLGAYHRNYVGGSAVRPGDGEPAVVSAGVDPAPDDLEGRA